MLEPVEQVCAGSELELELDLLIWCEASFRVAVFSLFAGSVKCVLDVRSQRGDPNRRDFQGVRGD